MLDKNNTGLIIVDIQGKLARLVHDSDNVINHCQKLINGIKVLGMPVIVLEQNPDKLGNTVEELRACLSNYQPITKYTFDGCAEPKFLQTVKDTNVDTWLLCGIETHICVYQTASSLIKLGYKVQLVNDCVASRLPENKTLAMERLAAIGAEITGVEMCLYELVKDCRAPEFKQILGIVK